MEELEEEAERPVIEPELEAAESEAAPPRRRRTLPLIGAAVALGLVAGACTGYLIQANRAVTPLPSLSQATLAQGKGTVEPLSAAQDRRVKTDGDLRKLLLTKPTGARAPYTSVGNEWLDLAGYAETFQNPDAALSARLGEEFRRAAVTAWRVGNSTSVEIRLVQYHQNESLAAKTNAADAFGYETQPYESATIPGTSDGAAYVFDGLVDLSGGAQAYSAEAHAWRGDIELQIWMYGTKPIPKAKIVDLAARQMERL
ncbi:hypothetical protein OK074_3184 [Actinobacteria bacterium OK074]|nr:hypothetical protein OK074_3184 [Actinobacteria bacterium OK074]